MFCTRRAGGGPPFSLSGDNIGLFPSHSLRHFLHECSVLYHSPHITSHFKNPRERDDGGLTSSPSADLAPFFPHMHQ